MTALRTSVICLTLFGLSACTPRVRGPIEPREDTAPWPQVMLSDRELGAKIAVRQPIVTQDAAGLLFVTIPLRSTTRHQMTIEYRVTFYDQNRVPIQETTWFPRTLPPFTQETLTVNSTSPRADDFQIDIRPAK
jgi:uncharacterized protein YcfL